MNPIYDRLAGRRSPKFIENAKQLVVDEYNKNRAPGVEAITEEDVFIVWFSKVLQNWKALVGTHIPDDHKYYEVTYDGDNKRAYVDTYIKKRNACFWDNGKTMSDDMLGLTQEA
jgi:hypothetical protein